MQELILYTQDAPLEVPADRVAGWMLIARGKVKMDGILQGHKMVIEKLLSDVAKNPLQRSLETEIATFRKIQSEMVNDRKKFTAIFDYIKDGCMTIEKEYDPKTNAALANMEISHLNWKKAESAKQQATENKQRETEALKAHVMNMYQAQATKYRMEIRQLIHIAYTSCIKALTPADQVQHAIDLCVQAASNVRPMVPAPFNNVLLTLPELQAIAQTIPQPDFKHIWDELMKELVEKFSLYANDLAAADVVIEQSTIDLQHVQAMEDQALQNTVATNNLVAAGSVFIADKVEIKVKKSIKVVDNDPGWVLKIMSAFISSFNVVMPLITVKSYSNLSVKQMAAALDKAGIEIVGIDYVTTEK